MLNDIYAVIDFGSNTVNLAVYDFAGFEMKPILRQKNVLSIIRHIENGEMTKEGIGKAVEVISDFQRIANEKTQQVYCFATASLRGIKNRREVTDRIKEKTDIDIDIVSGKREAFYNYLGVMHALKVENAVAADIGGGSTELILIRNGKLQKCATIPTGALRLYIDYAKGKWPGKAEIAGMEQCMESHLKKIDWLADSENDRLCTIGGTAKAVVKLQRALNPNMDNAKGHAYDAADLDTIMDYLSSENGPSQTIETMLPDRAHIIIPGLIALRSIVKASGIQKVVLSKYGVREGYLFEKIYTYGGL